MKVFIDTGAWLALEVINDINHHEAEKKYKAYKGLRSVFCTNDLVLSETYTRLIYDVDLKASEKFHEQVKNLTKNGELAMFEIDSSGRDAAWFYLKKFSDHKLSFTDATIIANFKEYRIDEIFTFDRHFKEINLPTNLP